MSEDSSGKKPRTSSFVQRQLKRRSVRVLGLSLWLLLGFIAAQILVLVVFQALFSASEVASLSVVVLSTVVAAVTYIIALFLVVGTVWWRQKWSKKQALKRLGLTRHLTVKDVGLALIGYLPYLASSILLVVVITILVPGFDAEQAQELGFDSLANNLEYVLAFVALVILAPIVEEVLFRGYLFGALRGIVSFIPATLIVSALFGLVHGQWNVALDTFVLSLVLCWLREYTGAIWAPIALHMIKNGLAFTLLFVF